MNSIWLLCERETDLKHESTKMFVKAFEEKFRDNFQIMCSNNIIICISDKEKLYITDIQGKMIDAPKIVFFTSNLPYFILDKEIVLLRHLEMMGVYIVDSVDGIINCENKLIQLSILSKAKLPIPKTICATNAEFKKVIQNFGVNDKYIIKSIHGCRGNQIFLSAGKDMLNDISGCLNHELPYLFQEYIEYSHGKTIRVSIINNRVIASYLMKSNNNKLISNTYHGSNFSIISNSAAEDLALKAASCFNLGIAGVDLLFKKDGSFVICEVNIDPGLATGNLEHDDIIAKAIIDIVSLGSIFPSL